MTHADTTGRLWRLTRRWRALALTAAALGAPAAAADGYSTDWAPSAKSEARLVAGGGALAGFEIKLAPGAITYWRDPGDAGVPPSFDFSGSDNVAEVTPRFPAPKRIQEPDGGEAFGYETGVVIPLKITPRDPTKPVTLALLASYAVCEKLCLPAKAKLTLMLPEGASPYASAVEAALAAAPRLVAPEAFGALAGAGAGLAPVRAPRARAGARPVRRAAAGLVGDRRPGAGRWGPGLFRDQPAREAEGRGAARPAGADDDGRGGTGRNDRDRPVEARAALAPGVCNARTSRDARRSLPLRLERIGLACHIRSAHAQRPRPRDRHRLRELWTRRRSGDPDDQGAQHAADGLARFALQRAGGAGLSRHPVRQSRRRPFDPPVRARRAGPCRNDGEGPGGGARRRSYALDDMASDAAGLLAALGIESPISSALRWAA